MTVFFQSIKIFKILLLIFCLGFLGCFGGVKNSGKVRGYEPGQVLMQKSSYQVGVLPQTWRLVELKKKAAVTFYHRESGASIATAAFCDQAYNDSPLKMLTRHLFPGLENTEVQKQESLTLDHREALRTWLLASVDGQRMALDLVVIKKDACLFDFFLTHSSSLALSEQKQAQEDFEQFFKAFRFRGF